MAVNVENKNLLTEVCSTIKFAALNGLKYTKILTFLYAVSPRQCFPSRRENNYESCAMLVKIWDIP